MGRVDKLRRPRAGGQHRGRRHCRDDRPNHSIEGTIVRRSTESSAPMRSRASPTVADPATLSGIRCGATARTFFREKTMKSPRDPVARPAATTRCRLSQGQLVPAQNSVSWSLREPLERELSEFNADDRAAFRRATIVRRGSWLWCRPPEGDADVAGPRATRPRAVDIPRDRIGHRGWRLRAEDRDVAVSGGMNPELGKGPAVAVEARAAS